MSTSLFPISNDIFLFALLVGLVYLLFLEFIADALPSLTTSSTTSTGAVKKSTKKRHVIPKRCRPLLSTPIFSSSVSRKMVHMEIQSFAKFVPPNVCVGVTVENDTTENIRKRSANSPHGVATMTHRKSIHGHSSADTPGSQALTNRSSLSSPSKGAAVASTDAMVLNDYDVCKKVIFPFPQGCDPDGAEAKTLLQKFPQLSRPDVVRYLVARKGNLQAAEEMIEKCLAWRHKMFPLNKRDCTAAFQTKCFFPYGRARDGSPVVYMRGGLYDSTKATPEQYVLAAAYTIDWSLKQCPDQTNVTVLVHTVNIPGAPNQSADTNFIKLFIQVSIFTKLCRISFAN